MSETAKPRVSDEDIALFWTDNKHDHWSATDAILDLRDARARIAELEADLQTTKSLIENYTSSTLPRGGVIHDWWAVAVLDRRKHRATIATLTRQIGEARDALEPFADNTNRSGSPEGFADDCRLVGSDITLGALRTAARVHASLSTSADTGVKDA